MRKIKTMYLKSLEISGFKSFAKKDSLDFTAPISAIVGPNGSGKSNIAEAFQFVLGEQSIKSMRGKRGEDLIFSGSKNERPLNRASVKVVFDNTSRFLDIDFDEVIIERIVFRDGINQYFVNNSRVRLKDISELLAGANIGSSGHHIISQGEADRILSINSKERREIIEEALGLKIYQYKILESEKKLLKVEENLKSVESLLIEIKPHLNFLKKQVKKIEQSFELRENLKNLYREYFKRETVYIKNKKNYIRENKLPLIDEIKVMNEDLIEAREVLKKESSVNQENRETLKLEESLREARNKKSNLSRELGQLEGMIVFEQRRIKKEETRQQESESRLIRFKEVKIFLNDLQNQLANFQNLSVGEITKKIKDNISDFIARNSQLDAIPENINGEELKKLNEEKKELDIKLKSIIEKEKVLSEEYRNLLNNLQKQKDFGQKAEIKIFEIKAKKAEADARLNSLNELEYQIDIEDENLKRELNDAYMLAGRESTQFFDFEISENDVMGEERQRQAERMKNIEKIKIKLEDMGGGAGEEIMKEYKEVKERDEFLRREINDLNNSENSLRDLIKELREKLDNKFKEGLKKINKQFNEFFGLVFGGGRAGLLFVKIPKRKKSDYLETEFLNEDEKEKEQNLDVPYEQEGIDIDISLPNKRTKGLQMLSGGERSLTSIALLFAMSQIKPPPFIILDETDAALDEANSRRYGDMIENLSKYSQLILITHNRETMSRAGILYGITMGMDGVSRLLSVKLEEAVKVAK